MAKYTTGHRHRPQTTPHNLRPVAAHRRRGTTERSGSFTAPELWHEPLDRTETEILVQPAGDGFIHPVTVEDVRARIAQLPARFSRGIEVIQFSAMTRKRKIFPLYGMQWGPNVYLYPIEESLCERYTRPPKPSQLQEARMYGGVWTQVGREWELRWTSETIRDFYLNNVLIHEIGHLHDHRNTNFHKREQYAEWFAIEYGYRPTRKLSTRSNGD